MNKPVAGLLVGAGLGLLDGATAWLTPAVRPAILSILVGSTFKGMLVGLLCGLIARKIRSVPTGIAAGAILGLVFAYIVAALPSDTGAHYYLQIMLPGFIAGGVIGFLTQHIGHGARAVTIPQ